MTWAMVFMLSRCYEESDVGHLLYMAMFMDTIMVLFACLCFGTSVKW